MVDLNLPALFAGLAASVGIYAHGILGQRWLVAQLGSVEMRPTPLSRNLFVAVMVVVASLAWVASSSV
jgi:hypothetical protein